MALMGMCIWIILAPKLPVGEAEHGFDPPTIREYVIGASKHRKGVTVMFDCV